MKEKGFSTLFVTIILGSIALSMAVWISTSSFWSIQEGIDTKIVEQTKALANACAEVALDVIRLNPSYTGTDTLSIDDNSCQYIIANIGGFDRRVEIIATIKNITKEIEIQTEGLNPIRINTWKENL